MTQLDTPWRREETFLHDLNRQYRDHPHHVAVVGRRTEDPKTESLTYRDLTVWAARLRRVLLAQGIHRGDRVAVQICNRWEMAALAFACLGVGAVLVPIPPGIDTEELVHRITLVETTLVFLETSPHTVDSADRISDIRSSAPDVVVVLIGDQNISGAPTLHQLLQPSPNESAANAELIHAAAALDPDDPTLLLFTSGTTGPSKAVIHSHNSLYAALYSYIDNFDFTDTTVIAVTTPVVHYSGLVQGIFASTSVGGTTVIQDTRDPAHYLSLVASTGATVMYGPPHTLLALASAQRATKHDVSTLGRVIVGSAPVVSTLVTEMADVFGADTSSLWGMSEFGPAVLTAGDAPATLPAISNGTAIAGVELRIVPDARSTAGSPVGRLFVRGASRALGYFGQQDRFDASIDHDDWFDTGDLARDLGEAGIRVLGRAADIIWSHGSVVPAVEIEAAIQLVDGICEASVIETDDGALCVVIARDEPPRPLDPTLHTVLQRLERDGFEQWCLPNRMVVLDRLPKTSTGKIRKRLLRSEFGASTGLDAHDPVRVVAVRS